IINDTQLSKYVYIGLHTTGEVIRIDGSNGNIVKRISVAPTMPYGLVLDRDGKVWVQGRENEPGTLAVIDTQNNDAVKRYPGAKSPSGTACNYGITADSRGLIYSSWMRCVARFNPLTASWESFDVSGAGELRGLAIDNKQQLWVADDQVGMHHIDASAA